MFIANNIYLLVEIFEIRCKKPTGISGHWNVLTKIKIHTNNKIYTVTNGIKFDLRVYINKIKAQDNNNITFNSKLVLFLSITIFLTKSKLPYFEIMKRQSNKGNIYILSFL